MLAHPGVQVTHQSRHPVDRGGGASLLDPEQRHASREVRREHEDPNGGEAQERGARKVRLRQPARLIPGELARPRRTRRQLDPSEGPMLRRYAQVFRSQSDCLSWEQLSGRGPCAGRRCGWRCGWRRSRHREAIVRLRPTAAKELVEELPILCHRPTEGLGVGLTLAARD